MEKGKLNFCLVASGNGQKFLELPLGFSNSPSIRNLKTLYSSVSYGSESRTITTKKNNFKNRFNKKLFIKVIETLRSKPFLLFKKIKNVFESLSPIGYSSITLDEETNKYVIAFGQYASHCSYVNVPAGMTFEINEEDLNHKTLSLLSTTGILSIAINGCKGAIEHCERNNNNALIIGGGLLGVMSYYYLKLNNYKINILDPDKACLSNLLSLNPSRISDGFSIIIDTSGSSKALPMYLNDIKSYSSICLLGESDFPDCKADLEKKNCVLTFCNSFGSDRGVVDIEYNLSNINSYPKYRSMKSNIKEAYEMIINGHLNELNKCIKYLKPTSENLQYSMGHLNIIDWTKL